MTDRFAEQTEDLARLAGLAAAQHIHRELVKRPDVPFWVLQRVNDLTPAAVDAAVAAVESATEYDDLRAAD